MMGFKFESEPDLIYHRGMDRYIGKTGTISGVGTDFVEVDFGGNKLFYYPLTEAIDNLLPEESKQHTFSGTISFAEASPLDRSVLQEAEDLITGDRADQYGKASENFNDIAAGWSVLFKTKVTAEQVALAMGWLKMCRFNHKPGRDSIVDLAGYAGCIEKIQKGL